MNILGINFYLGEDLDMLRDAVRDFAQAGKSHRALKPLTRRLVSPWIYGEKFWRLRPLRANRERRLWWLSLRLSCPYDCDGRALTMPQHRSPSYGAHSGMCQSDLS